MDQLSIANPIAHRKARPPFSMRLNRGDRYVKLYKAIVMERDTIVPRDTVRSYALSVVIFTSRR